jgi:hypothetical protein
VLSNEIMGYVALWILWGNTLLVALAALKRAGALAGRARELSRSAGQPVAGAERLVRAKIIEHDGPHLAAFRVDQLGRYGTGALRSIRWHDRKTHSELSSGVVEVDGERVSVAPEACEVWVGADEAEAAAACPSRATFEEAYPSAKKTRGVERDVVVELGAGRSVWLFGRLKDQGGKLTLGAPSNGLLLVSAMDPIVWLARRVWFVRLVFVPAIFAGAAVCTALALTAPVFESLTSKLGGLLGLVFFLVVLPAGTALRDFLREPSQRIVRGVWEDPASAEQAVPSATVSDVS